MATTATLRHSDSVIVPPYHYEIRWSEREQAHVGTCEEFPNLRATGATAQEARARIRAQAAAEVARRAGNHIQAPAAH